MTQNRVEDAYRRLHPRLWHALWAYSGDREIAGDAEADAFDQALRRGDAIHDVDAWVWRTAFKIAAGLLADRRNRDEGPVLLPETGLVEETPAVEFVAQLGELTEQQRAIVVLRYLGDFRPTEIAELIDSTPGSVRVQLHRAHGQLRARSETHDDR